jgi:hypothetical protein
MPRAARRPVCRVLPDSEEDSNETRTSEDSCEDSVTPVTQLYPQEPSSSLRTRSSGMAIHSATSKDPRPIKACSERTRLAKQLTKGSGNDITSTKSSTSETPLFATAMKKDQNQHHTSNQRTASKTGSLKDLAKRKSYPKRKSQSEDEDGSNEEYRPEEDEQYQAPLSKRNPLQNNPINAPSKKHLPSRPSHTADSTGRDEDDDVVTGMPAGRLWLHSVVGKKKKKLSHMLLHVRKVSSNIVRVFETSTNFSKLRLEDRFSKVYRLVFWTTAFFESIDIARRAFVVQRPSNTSVKHPRQWGVLIAPLLSIKEPRVYNLLSPFFFSLPS